MSPRPTSTKQTILTSNPSCQVCGNSPAGWHCGTVTCEACKKFFIRKLEEGIDDLKCTLGNNACIITKASRTNCKLCRYNRCLSVGMKNPADEKERDKSSSQQTIVECAICKEISSGFHFGVLTCEGCKGFYRRITPEQANNLRCEYNGNCDITHKNRNNCRYCRYQRCLKVGMSQNSNIDSKMGRQSNLFKEKLKEVAKNSSLLESAMALSSVPISFTTTKSNEVKKFQVEDSLEPVYKDLIKELFLAEEKSLQSLYYSFQDINPKIPVEFIYNHIEKCKRFLESIKLYQEFDEIDQRSILLNSIHSIRIVEAITNPDTLQPKYLEFDAEMLKVISVNFPSLTSINEDLRDLSESLRELRLDSQEITIYKAYLALFSTNFRNRKSHIKNRLILTQALRKFMFARRNENETCWVLFELSTFIYKINLNIQKQLLNDLEKPTEFKNEYNFLRQLLY